MTSKQLQRELEQSVDLCLSLLDEKTGGDDKEASNLTHLSVSTLWRLRHHTFTLAVRWGTIRQLAHAAGLSIAIEKSGVYVSSRRVT